MFPIGENVLVKPDENQNMTESGIILGGEEVSSTGTIAAVGPGKFVDGELVELQVKPGNRVIFAGVNVKDSHRKLTMNGNNYLLMLESQLFGIIEESEND